MTALALATLGECEMIQLGLFPLDKGTKDGNIASCYRLLLH